MPVTVHGSTELSASLGAQAARARDPSAFLQGEAAALDQILQQSWNDDRSPDGQPWSPRIAASRDARSGRARPRRDGRVGRLLERTGLLRASEFVRVAGQSIVVGNDAPYARLISEGTRFMRARGLFPSGSSAGPAGQWLTGFPGRLARFVTGSDS